MEFKVKKEHLLPALQLINSIVEKKQTLPILSHVVFSLENNNLSIVGSDLEIELELNIIVEGIKDGKSTLSSSKIHDIFKSLNDESDVHFDFKDDQKTSIISNQSKFSLSSFKASDYPRMDHNNEIFSLDLEQKSLLKILNETSFSMAIQDVRYYLNGLLLEINTDNIKSVSTDGHRLGLSCFNIKTNLAETNNFILPRKAVLEIVNILNDTDDIIKLKISKNQINLKTDSKQLIVRLIDGKYPNYNKVIPENGNKTFIINKQELKKSLYRASILSNEKYRGVRMNFSNGLLNISANNSDKEESSDQLDINYSGDPLEIGFNVSYLLDAINAVNSEEVMIIAKDSVDSCIVKNTDSDYPIYIVMPMRI